MEQINKALSYIKSKDMVSLKSIYKQLFHKIIVRPLDAVKVELEFVLNKATSSIRNGEVAFCTAKERESDQQASMSKANGDERSRISDLSDVNAAL